MTSTARSVSLATAAIAALALLSASALPYWSIAGLMLAAAESDVARAEGFMQERHVQLTIREQTSAAVKTQALKAAAQGWDGAEDALHEESSRPLADEISHAASVTDLIRTHLPAQGTRLATAWRLMRSGTGHWASGADYRIPATGGYEFGWQRLGARWQLVDVSIPPHVIEAAAITGPDPVIEPEVQVFKHPNERTTEMP
jgi:hypothetical protein